MIHDASTIEAEISILNLKNCLVNLPPRLVTSLISLNTPIQNVVVELTPVSTHASNKQSSIFVGWTGHASKAKLGKLGGRDRAKGDKSKPNWSQEPTQVDIDAAFAHTIGLSNGQRMLVTIHVDPPIVHTIHIEPITPDDWELVELHTQFLELNLLSQLRAVPNPAYVSSDGSATPPHILTLHLTPTTTANVKVLRVEPASLVSARFAKISPNAEVVVAPKLRDHNLKNGGDHHSIASTKLGGSNTSRKRGHRDEPVKPIYLRAVDRRLCTGWFDDGTISKDMSIYVDASLRLSKELKDVHIVQITLLRPHSLQSRRPDDLARPDETHHEGKAVAKLRCWDDSPNAHAAALSPLLCSALGYIEGVGGSVKITPAVGQLPKNIVRKLQIFPFVSVSHRTEGLRFGGESKAEKDASCRRFRQIHSRFPAENPLTGPLVDGTMLMPISDLEVHDGWEGGIIKFEYDPAYNGGPNHSLFRWAVDLDANISLDFHPPVPRPSWMLVQPIIDRFPSHGTELKGIDDIITSVRDHIAYSSSVILTGARGSGKTAVVRLIAGHFRQRDLYSTLYIDCEKLTGDNMSVPKVKEELEKLFLAANWSARLGGRALVILDDLDKICQTETELQVGNNNDRHQLTSEVVCRIIRDFCGGESSVSIVVTAQGKAKLNGVLLASHALRHVVELKSPDRNTRQLVLESILRPESAISGRAQTDSGKLWLATTEGGSDVDSESGQPKVDNGLINQADTAELMGRFSLHPDLDLLDIAASTEGFMPADLCVLVSRAQGEVIMRVMADKDSDMVDLVLAKDDFSKALKGFTPAGLRNVALQHPTTRFDSVGGLYITRRILLETLDFPTKYAPIFAKCPLRLRSGLLLYGYPGCGKSLLANAVAGECGFNFISVKGPEVLNKYIGASEQAIRDLFNKAQAAKPCVLFFDEFDSIAPRRGHDSTGVTDRVVNQLLVQMDGAEGISGVYVLAATSRPDLIDPALLRPGRLDKSVLCDLPSHAERVDILKTLARQAKPAEDLTATDDAFEEIARRTEEYSGADLQALISNAQLAAVHQTLGKEWNMTKGTGSAVEPQALESPSSTKFAQFHYGKPEGRRRHLETRADCLTPAEMTEIRTKLDNLKIARRTANVANARTGVTRDAQPNAGARDAAVVVVEWSHLVEALEGTGPALSQRERDRLHQVYHEFVVGRSGQLWNGENSTEIGGRSSLM